MDGSECNHEAMLRGVLNALAASAEVERGRSERAELVRKTNPIDAAVAAGRHAGAKHAYELAARMASKAERRCERVAS